MEATLFLLYLSEHASLFFHYERTSEVESFHSTVNFYYRKGLRVCFDEYQAKVQMAILVWNERRFGQFANNFKYDWKSAVVNAFVGE